MNWLKRFMTGVTGTNDDSTPAPNPLAAPQDLARGMACTLDELLSRADVTAGPIPASKREQLVWWLDGVRGFPGGFWHPGDVDSMTEMIHARLEELGLDVGLLSTSAIESIDRESDGPVVDDDDEERGVRHQIGKAAARLNEHLEANASDARLYPFKNLANRDPIEPVWLLLTSSEREVLMERGVLERAEGIERDYDPAP